jgi:RNA polymerase-binding transcription factor DksA
MTARDSAALALELRRELARVERALPDGGQSDERDELLQALQRISDGSYGICTQCARRIPKARLEVMPATQRCAACAGVRSAPGTAFAR